MKRLDMMPSCTLPQNANQHLEHSCYNRRKAAPAWCKIAASNSPRLSQQVSSRPLQLPLLLLSFDPLKMVLLMISQYALLCSSAQHIIIKGDSTTPWGFEKVQSSYDHTSSITADIPAKMGPSHADDTHSVQSRCNLLQSSSGSTSRRRMRLEGSLLARCKEQKYKGCKQNMGSVNVPSHLHNHSFQLN